MQNVLLTYFDIQKDHETYFKKYLLEYNGFTVLVSSVYQSESVIHRQITLFQILLPCKSLQSIEESSLCYRVGPHQLSISYISVSSVTQSCPTLCDPMNCSTPGLPVHHQLLEFTQTHVHQVRDAIQPSHPLSSPSSPAPNPSQHQKLFQ